MYRSIIITYSLEERSLYNRENNTSIRGSWLYELAKKITPYETDKHICLVGLDDKKRIEIKVSLPMFEKLKVDTMFIQKAINLRRIRTTKEGVLSRIEYLAFPISDFDNDLDDENVKAFYEDLSNKTKDIINK